jgi:prepilin-type N-terminal cleavage/methylation domain-containing protein
MHKLQLRSFSLRHQRGFTLLEAVIALVILAGGLLAMFRFHGTSIEVTGETKNRAAATALAQAKLEELRAFTTAAGYAARMADGSEANLANTDYDGVAYAATFSRAWVVTATANPDVNQVDVTVTWPRRDNVDGSVMLSAMVVKADPQGGAGEIANAIDNGGSPDPGTWDTGGGEGEGGDDQGGDDQGGGDPGGDDPGGDDGADDYPYSIIISGSVSIGGNGNMSFSNVSGSGNYAAACTGSGSSYSCTISGIGSNDSWSGAIVFESSKGTCSPSLSFSSITSNQVVDVALIKSGNSCVLAS